MTDAWPPISIVSDSLKISPLLEAPVEERERNPDDVFSILLDPSRTEQEFKWKTRTSLSEGVRAAIEYYREFGIEETFTHLRASVG